MRVWDEWPQYFHGVDRVLTSARILPRFELLVDLLQGRPLDRNQRLR
jgi:hypothetical protein